MKYKFILPENVKNLHKNYAKILKQKEIDATIEKMLKISPLFVHFSDVTKFGINMKYKWWTPMGIYGFPVHYSEQYIQGLKNFDFYSSYEYGYDKKYLHFFTLKDNQNVLYISKYARDDLTRDIEKLKKFYIENANNRLSA